jgi:diguanylate cyclase (GGDEF)-like protein
MDSEFGLIIQLAGVASITLLTLFLRRSIKVDALRHWTNAWLFMCVALFCLRLAFGFTSYSIQLFSFYFLAQYAYGFLLIAGCRSLADRNSFRFTHELLILPFIVVAFGLPFVSDDFNFILNIHSLIVAGFIAVALTSLWRAPIRTFGWKVMFVALALLVVNFLQYFAIYTLRQQMVIDFDHLQYNSVIDLVLQTLLGFGMVIVLLEQVLADAKSANDKLQRAQERLEELVHVDPLTAALNRHAFYGLIKNSEWDDASGCIGFFDIDNLKALNDHYGHVAGDAAIRSVVKSIRELIRPEDLIFRWGGDEFFVLMIGLDSSAATSRMRVLENSLKNKSIDNRKPPVDLAVSFGFADFSDLSEVDAAIRSADAGMYRNKQLRKSTGGGTHSVDAVRDNTPIAASR